MAKQQIEHPLDQSKDIGNFPIQSTVKRTNRDMFYGKMEVLANNWNFNKNTRAELEFSEEPSALALWQSGREDSQWYRGVGSAKVNEVFELGEGEGGVLATRTEGNNIPKQGIHQGVYHPMRVCKSCNLRDRTVLTSKRIWASSRTTRATCLLWHNAFIVSYRSPARA